jgi:hypothetical protein
MLEGRCFLSPENVLIGKNGVTGDGTKSYQTAASAGQNIHKSSRKRQMCEEVGVVLGRF